MSHSTPAEPAALSIAGYGFRAGTRARRNLPRIVVATLLHRSHTLPVVLITASVVLANSLALAHVVTLSPLALFGWVGPALHGRLPGAPYIDANAGYVVQAVGHLSATS